MTKDVLPVWVYGRKPNEKPVFREGDLEAIVTGDQRVKELVPSHSGIAASISFNAFQALRAEYPDASVDEILKIWKSRLDQAGETYASKLTGYLQTFHDDMMVAARFQSLDAKEGVPQRVGMRPTSDRAKRVNDWFVDRLEAFRKGGWRRDPDGLGIIAAVRLWAKANRPIFTKASAFQLWHKKLRFRNRYRDLEKHISEQFRSVSPND